MVRDVTAETRKEVGASIGIPKAISWNMSTQTERKLENIRQDGRYYSRDSKNKTASVRRT